MKSVSETVTVRVRHLPNFGSRRPFMEGRLSKARLSLTSPIGNAG
jgi:hypothetical protein